MIDSYMLKGYIGTLPTSKPYSRLQVAEWVQANSKVDVNTPQFVRSMIQNLETEYAEGIFKPCRQANKSPKSSS